MYAVFQGVQLHGTLCSLAHFDAGLYPGPVSGSADGLAVGEGTSPAEKASPRACASVPWTDTGVKFRSFIRTAFL